jgi:hypothetical protein
MTPPTDLNFFADPDLDRAVGLIFELAAQLHVERQRRSALEQLLIERKLINREEIDGLVKSEKFTAGTRADLDRSLRQLMRVITERGDAAGPLRAEALD